MIKAISIVILVLSPVAAVAQFVPTLDSEPRVCPDQPPRPDWMENAHVRDAHKNILVQQMYRAQGLNAVVDTGDCSCETRFPSWDAVSEYYFENYAGLDRHEILERTSEYSRTANELRFAAKSICEEQGNW